MFNCFQELEASAPLHSQPTARGGPLAWGLRGHQVLANLALSECSDFFTSPPSLRQFWGLQTGLCLALPRHCHLSPSSACPVSSDDVSVFLLKNSPPEG